MKDKTPAWYLAIRNAMETMEQWVESSLYEQRGRAELQSDEQLSHHLHVHATGQPPRLVFGRITYTLPYLHWYRVQLDGMSSESVCCAIGSPAHPFSVVDGDPYPPGCRVLVAVDEGARWSYIVGAIPDPVVDGRVVFPDCHAPDGGTGFKREPYLHEVLKLFEKEGGTIDFSNWRPLDSTALGEFSKFAPLGGRLRVGMTDAQLSISEACGLELFEQDQFARLSGYNYEQMTNNSLVEAKNDSGEALHYEGYTPYPHEALGLLAHGENAFQAIDGETWQYTDAAGPLAPDPQDLTGFYRLEEHRGYLGQGHIRQLAAPAATGGTHALSQETAHHGLFREHLALTGGWHVESAYGFGLWKRAAIPWPKRTRRAEDPAGDDQEGGYRFAGQFGEGAEHKVQDAPQASGRLASQKAVVDLNSYLAYQFNWQALHAFHYHTRDWYTPEETDGSLNQLVAPPDYQQLQSQQWLSLPDPQTVTVDPRLGPVNYYPTQAGYQVLPSGNSVMLGGQGCEVRMVDGNLFLSAPGDIHIIPGRRFVVWAGDDAIVRANRSLDLVANELDVRIKAGQNMEMASGVSGTGRTLIENQATGQQHDYDRKYGEDVKGSGILVKTKNGQLATYAASTYIRSGGDGLSPGPLVLDAGQGTSQLRVVASDVHFHVENQIIESFPYAGTKQAANMRSAVANRMGAGLEVDGTFVVANGGAVVNGHVNVVNGHIATQQAEQYNNYVGGLEGSSLGLAQASVNNANTRQRLLQQQERRDYESYLEQTHYSSPQNGLGNGEFIERVGFSFRTEEQYGSQGFVLPEMHWQHLIGNSASTWTEQPVIHQNRETYPFPGEGPWKTEQSFLRLEPALYNPQAGVDRPRSSGAYENAQHNDWTPATMDGTLPVIVT